jgi:hypothetical protein
MEIPIKNANRKEVIILNFILDESGSMSSQREAVIGGFNEYIETMKAKSDNADYLVNLVKFGDKTEFVFKNKSLKDVRPITKRDYNPTYNTALHDAIGNTIRLTDGQIELYRDPTTIFYIFTDGYENASTEYKPEALRNLITRRENAGGWTFTFIGADRGCLAQAAQIGIGAGNTILFNVTNSASAIRAMSASTCTYASNLTAGTFGSSRRSATLFKDAGYDNSRNIDEQENAVPLVDTSSAAATPIIPTFDTTSKK